VLYSRHTFGLRAGVTQSKPALGAGAVTRRPGWVAGGLFLLALLPRLLGTAPVHRLGRAVLDTRRRRLLDRPGAGSAGRYLCHRSAGRAGLVERRTHLPPRLAGQPGSLEAFLALGTGPDYDPFNPELLRQADAIPRPGSLGRGGPDRRWRSRDLWAGPAVCSATAWRRWARSCWPSTLSSWLTRGQPRWTRPWPSPCCWPS
jgi:hypothetical protein